MEPVEAFTGSGELVWADGTVRRVAYDLTRYQGQSGNGMPIPGLFRIEGAIDLGGETVPAGSVGRPLTLRLDDGRALGVTLADDTGLVRSEGHGPSRCLCC